MDEPIISIYDMLVERHKQLRKIDRVKDTRPIKHWAQDEATGKDGKTIKNKPIKGKQDGENSSAMSEQQQQLMVRRQANVVTASDLTQKPGGSVTIPIPTKKDVLNQLVEKMSSKVREVQSKLKSDAVPAKKSASSKTSIGKKLKSKTSPDSRSIRSIKLKKIKRSSLPSSAKKTISVTNNKKEDNRMKKPIESVSKPPTARPKIKVRTPVSGSRKSSLQTYKSKTSFKDKSGVSLATPGNVSRWRV